MTTNPEGYMRNYWKKDGKKNYKKYHGSPEEIKKRASRNQARASTNAGPGQHVDHINKNPLDNRKSNIRVVSELFNLRRKK